MAPHSSTLAWKIPWTEEPGRLQSMGSQRVRQDWATSLHFTLIGIFGLFTNLERMNDISHWIMATLRLLFHQISPNSQPPSFWKWLTSSTPQLLNVLPSQVWLSLFCSVSISAASQHSWPSPLPGDPQRTSAPLPRYMVSAGKVWPAPPCAMSMSDVTLMTSLLRTSEHKKCWNIFEPI